MRWPLPLLALTVLFAVLTACGKAERGGAGRDASMDVSLDDGFRCGAGGPCEPNEVCCLLAAQMEGSSVGGACIAFSQSSPEASCHPCGQLDQPCCEVQMSAADRCGTDLLCNAVTNKCVDVALQFCGDGIMCSPPMENEMNCPSDCGCDGDMTCEPERGETPDNCPVACGCNNNGECDFLRGENATNCSNDCGCNDDGICQGERHETPEDCADCEI